MNSMELKAWARTELIKRAITDLQHARTTLRSAGANKAADYVARALKSAEGAQRHADGQRIRAQMGRDR